jgi:hypothetical protein
MENIDHLIQRINKELAPQFEEKLRSYLKDKDKEWLIEQIVRLTLDANSLESMDQRADRRVKAKRISERVARLKAMELDEAKLAAFIEQYQGYDRERFIAEGYLLKDAPVKGTDLILPEHRSQKGNDLLKQTKDILFGLLFGSERTKTNFARVQRELLALTVPRLKAHELDFMQATSELTVFGSWMDPENVSDDERAENVVLEMEYGEVASEAVGGGIIRTLSIINNLEINEQILYARMINIEQSTLIS